MLGKRLAAEFQSNSKAIETYSDKHGSAYFDLDAQLTLLRSTLICLDTTRINTFTDAVLQLDQSSHTAEADLFQGVLLL